MENRSSFKLLSRRTPDQTGWLRWWRWNLTCLLCWRLRLLRRVQAHLNICNDKYGWFSYRIVTLPEQWGAQASQENDLDFILTRPPLWATAPTGPNPTCAVQKQGLTWDDVSSLCFFFFFFFCLFKDLQVCGWKVLGIHSCLWAFS